MKQTKNEEASKQTSKQTIIKQKQAGYQSINQPNKQANTHDA